MDRTTIPAGLESTDPVEVACDRKNAWSGHCIVQVRRGPACNHALECIVPEEAKPVGTPWVMCRSLFEVTHRQPLLPSASDEMLLRVAFPSRTRRAVLKPESTQTGLVLSLARGIAGPPHRHVPVAKQQQRPVIRSVAQRRPIRDDAPIRSGNQTMPSVTCALRSARYTPLCRSVDRDRHPLRRHGEGRRANRPPFPAE